MRPHGHICTLDWNATSGLASMGMLCSTCQLGSDWTKLKPGAWPIPGPYKLLGECRAGQGQVSVGFWVLNRKLQGRASLTEGRDVCGGGSTSNSRHTTRGEKDLGHVEQQGER